MAGLSRSLSAGIHSRALWRIAQVLFWDDSRFYGLAGAILAVGRELYLFHQVPHNIFQQVGIPLRETIYSFGGEIDP